MWNKVDRYAFCRLLGKEAVRAVIDPELNRTVLAWEVLTPGSGVKFWSDVREISDQHDPIFCQTMPWREVSRRPADEDEARAFLGEVVTRETMRLKSLLILRQTESDEAAIDRTAQAGLEDSLALERFRRTQAARSRELKQTLDSLMKLRKETRPTLSSTTARDPKPITAETRRTPKSEQMPFVGAVISAMFEADAAKSRVEEDPRHESEIRDEANGARKADLKSPAVWTGDEGSVDPQPRGIRREKGKNGREHRRDKPGAIPSADDSTGHSKPEKGRDTTGPDWW